MKRLYEMHGQGHSARAIAQELGLARNTVLKYLRSPDAMQPKPRPPRGSMLDPYAQHIERRMAEGLENGVVLLRELRALGYEGAYSTLTGYLRPRRKGGQPKATMRFETASGEQAQVDWGSLGYVGADGKKHRIWVFVMTMGWSRACYAELVRKADTATFIQCHVNAFEYLGGVPRRCLYDNAKVVTLGKDEDGQTEWNLRMLDFARRLGFDIRLCQPYRAQTKGKVESGVKYVWRNMWPSIRFTDDADLNRQAVEWCDVVANRRIHGTTHRVPWEMLAEEGPHLGKLPDRSALAPYLRADRGMYFILRLTQLIVRPDSRLSVLRYKIAPKCLLPGPFGHSGVGGNPRVGGTVRSYNLVFTYPCQLSAGGSHGVQRRLRQLGGLPLWGALEVGGGRGAGGPTPGHGGGLGRR